MMRRFLTILFVLATTPLVAQEAGLRICIGPDGQLAKPGKYWLLQTYDDGRPPSVSLAMDTTDVITPDPPGPPQPDDVAVKIDKLLAAVVDPTKAATAKGVAEGYRQILLLVSSGMLTTPDNVRMAAKFALEAGLSAAGKMAEWRSFVEGMDALTKDQTLTEIVATYKTAMAKLGGSPDPPPPGPNPNLSQVTYVYEKDQGPVPPGVATALARLNAEDSSVVASEFEEDTLTGTGTVPTQYATALAEARKAGLPALVVQRGDQIEVVKAPKTESDVLDAVKGGGP